MTTKIDIVRWLKASDYDDKDTAISRVIFGSLFLMLKPTFSWIGEYPRNSYMPPPGPFQLLAEFPPPWFFVMLDYAVTVLGVCVLIGYTTKITSVLLSLLLLMGYGFSFSLGKIDHTILLALTPMFMAFANWGNLLSIDSRQGRTSGNQSSATAGLSAMRLLAVSIGVAMLTAALMKFRGGWLSLSSQAAYSHEIAQYFFKGREGFLAEIAVSTHLPLLWEAIDWMTVALEGALLILALSWRTWRIGLALICIFHLGVLLVFNISFWYNILAYIVFVRWSKVSFIGRIRGKMFLLFVPCIIAVEVLLVWLANFSIESTVIIFSGGISAFYLVNHLMVRPTLLLRNRYKD